MLETIFEAVKFAGLNREMENFNVTYDELKFFGHIMNSDVVFRDGEKTAAVTHFPHRTNNKAVREIFGPCAYYRRFVEGSSRKGEPVLRLTKDSAAFVWDQKQKPAFRELQRHFRSPPVLAYFDEDADTEMHTGASNVGLGTVVIQE